jgi:thioredoxin-dependent peroxiredoxin
MLGVGDSAPEFTGTTADGTPLALSSFRGKPLILYFYPKANTTGCTIEARGFTQHYSEFQGKGVAVVGVSVDSVESQKKFVDKCQIPFPLVADRDKSIARLYGVLGIWGIAKRVTFFIGADGKVQDVVSGLAPGPHLARALQRIKP